jgi:hypothetical protein
MVETAAATSGVHVLYKRADIPANKAIPVFAVSVTYSKH